MAGVVRLLTDPQQGIIAMAACAQDGNQRMPGVRRTVMKKQRESELDAGRLVQPAGRQVVFQPAGQVTLAKRAGRDARDEFIRHRQRPGFEEHRVPPEHGPRGRA